MTDRIKGDATRFQLEAILENAVDAIITIDEKGIIQSWNPATESLFGYTGDEIRGQNVSMLMPSPDSEKHDGYLANYNRTGKKQIIGIGREIAGKRKDGSTFPLHLAVSEISVGDRKYFTGIVRDLSDLKRAEAEQTNLGRIVEDSLNEVYFFDAETLKFINVNRGARENLGYSLPELTAMTPLSIKPSFQRSEFIELISPLISGERDKITFETIHQRRNGSCYDVEVHLQISWFKNRRVFVAFVLDITQRKAAERELHRLNDELEIRVEERTAQLKAAQAELVRSEKMVLLGQVSGGIAHEIRNPLNAIKTSAYYLLHAKQPSPEKVQEHLSRIDRQVTIIDNVITALSDVAKLPDPQLTPASIETILRPVVNSISLPPHTSIELEIPAELPDALVDANQIPIVFRNLIRNARDSMAEGGIVVVESYKLDDRIHVAVIDQGDGISPDVLDKIFEPFFSTKARGMGLGLAITRAILEKNRGELQVSSQQGIGSRFTVSLEAAR